MPLSNKNEVIVQFFTIVRIVGVLVMSFSVTMLLPALVALIYGDGGGQEFLRAFLLNFCFLIVVLFWIVLGGLGAVPFILLEHPDLNFSESVFESFSGLTTTGGTVITGLDELPKSILFYRQFLQWLGGMGIIVLAIAILPMIGLGKLYRAEMPGPLKDAETAKMLWQIYFLLTFLCAVAFWLAGMSPFDAISHSFSTISIGGFSTHDASIGYFESSAINYIAVCFLLISSINFGLHYALFSRLSDRKIEQKVGVIGQLYWQDYEFRSFVFIQVTLFVVCVAVLMLYNYYGGFSLTVEQAMFESVSISTTAGFSTSDFSAWPSFLPLLLVLASFIGGCAGSTGGGLKVIRVLLLYLQANREIHRFVHPNSVKPIKLGKHIFSDRIEEGIWAFFAAYFFVFVLCWFGAIACGMSIFDAFNAVLACLNNLGTALGNVSGGFAQVPDSAKWVLVLAMVCGRLEVFTLLVILSPVFWKD